MTREDKTVHRGDFSVLESEFEAAEEAFSKRSKASRTRDNATRAPIAPDLETWKDNQRGLDYPGVDTPTERPRQAIYDAPLPGDTARDDGIGLAIEEQTNSTEEMFEEYDSGMDSLADAVTDVFEL